MIFGGREFCNLCLYGTICVFLLLYFLRTRILMTSDQEVRTY